MSYAHRVVALRVAHAGACALLVGASLAAAPAARAQGTPPSGPPPGSPALPVERTAADSSLDSLAVRLQRAEEAIALLRQQLATQAASATQTESRSRFELSGRVLINGFTNSRRVNNVDVPQFVRPDTTAGLRQGGLGASIRQTSLTGTAFVPSVLRGEFRGDVTVDFFGGQPQPSPGAAPNPGGRHFPIPRLRTARGTLRWQHAEIMAGQDVPLIGTVEPVSVAAIGVPEFGTAGNLWLWLPQVRLTLERPVAFTGGPGPLRLGVQAAVLAPNNGDQIGTAGAIETDFDQAERSRRPYLEARVRARWGEEDRAGEIGIGVHQGWLAGLSGPLIPTNAIAATALIPLGRYVELRGEAYQGKAVRGLGGGGIAQAFVRPGVPLRTRAGWAQLNLRPAEFATLGGGCGIDAPRAAGAPLAPRLRNAVCEGHLIARPEGPVIVGLTYRRLRTSYARGPLSDDHVNLAIGYQF